MRLLTALASILSSRSPTYQFQFFSTFVTLCVALIASSIRDFLQIPSPQRRPPLTGWTTRDVIDE